MYVAPLTLEAESIKVTPSQIGELLDGVGALGIGFTITIADEDGETQPESVTVKL